MLQHANASSADGLAAWLLHSSGSKKNVVIVRGVSGSGKTTFAQRLKLELENLDGAPYQHQHIDLLSADDFFLGVDGYYDFDVKKLPEAHADCMQRYIQQLQENNRYPDAPSVVILHNTATRQWEYWNYVLAAELGGHKVCIVDLDVSTIEDLKRCAERCQHPVPLDVIAAQACRFERGMLAAVIPASF